MGKKIFLALVLSVLLVVPAGAAVPIKDIFVANCPFANPPGGSIQRITPAGVAMNLASGIGICAGSLVFDNAGNIIFVGEQGDPTIYRVDPFGNVGVFVTGLPLVDPVRLAWDSDGNLIVANLNGGNIVKVTPSGVMSVVASGAPLVAPFGIDIDGSGNYIVADQGGNSILRITPGGVKTTVASGGSIILPSDVRVDRTGNYIVANGDNSILKVTPGGAVSPITGPIPGAGFVVGLTIDTVGNYLVADYSRPAIYVVTPSGNITNFLVGPPLLSPTAIAQLPVVPTSAPSIEGWGMITLIVSLGIGASYYLKRLRIR
jgi:hypothetical protein